MQITLHQAPKMIFTKFEQCGMMGLGMFWWSRLQNLSLIYEIMMRISKLFWLLDMIVFDGYIEG